MPTPDHHNALHPIEVAAGGLTIQGFSISGLATWFVIPELDVMFDTGECPVEAIGINNVFLSHVHGDHSRCLLRHWQLRRMMNMSGATYFVPPSAVAGFRMLVRIEAEMEGVEEVVFPDFRVIPPDSPKAPLKKGVWVRSFSVDHRVESLGYTVGRTVQKLKPEFAHLTGPDIGAARKAGTEVTEAVDTALVTFIGDCTGESLAANTHIFDSKVVIIECTHVDDDQRERTAKYGHTHLRDIEAVLAATAASACEAVILKHFSMKEHPDHIRERVAALVPPAWASRVKVFLP